MPTPAIQVQTQTLNHPLFSHTREISYKYTPNTKSLTETPWKSVLGYLETKTRQEFG